MSLPVLAQHMASRGRNGDSMLVHMTPGEVGGLQALARAHGGSLTVNPDTGLPEAGFLKAILPLAAGFFLGPAGLGLTALQSGMAVGALGTLATGSLKEGLMMGLGAYGGSGLGASVANAGTGALSSAAGAGASAAGSNVAALPTAATADIAAAGATATPVPTAALPQGTALGPLEAPGLGAGSAEPGIGAAKSMISPVAQATPTVTASPSTLGPLTEAQAAPLRAYDLEMAQQRAVGDALSKAKPTDTLKAGIKELYKDPSRLLTKENLKYGLAAAAPMALSTPTISVEDEDKDSMIRPFTYDPYGGQYVRGTPYPSSQATTRFADGGAAKDTEDPAALYRRMIMQEYGNLGLQGIGTGASQIKQPEFDYWMGQLESGTVKPQEFHNLFQTKAQEAIQQNPNDPRAQFAGNFLSQQQARLNPPERAPTGQFDRMSGDSAAAFDYLMGRGPNPIRTTQPRVFAPYSEAVLGIASDPTTQRYTWDPTRGQYAVNPDFVAQKPLTPSKTDEEKAVTAAPTYDYTGSGAANGGIVALARGGMQESHLGDYSDGGRLLKGPGDGVSDSIPAVIGNKRPARLADGEFVIPARIVSELGNGSTNAGAKKLYAMMDRIQNNRRKSVGKGKVAVNSRSDKYLPA